MRTNNSKLRLAVAAAMVTGVALASSAFAGQTTSVGTDSSIFLTINDTTSGAGFVFDTGLSVTGFTGTSAESFNVSALGGSAYSQFMSSVATGDNLEYSVVGGSEATASTAPVTLDATGLQAPTVTTNGGITSSYNRLSTFLQTIANPAGSASYQSATAASGWYAAGYETGLAGDLHLTDSTILGSSLSFYQLVASALSGHAQGTLSTFAGSWLYSNGVLTYTIGSGSGGTGGTGGSGGGAPAVPLPASVVLLLSGLGLTGLMARRRRDEPAAA